MKVVDPVCKMTIEDKDAVGTSIYKGTTYYFCSPVCKEDFDKNPDAILNLPIPPFPHSGGFAEAGFVIFILICHSRLSGILLQHRMVQRGNKKVSGQARMTKCAWIIQLYDHRCSLLNL